MKALKQFLNLQSETSELVKQTRQVSYVGREASQLTETQQLRRALGAMVVEASAGLGMVIAQTPNTAAQAVTTVGTAAVMAITGFAAERHYNK